MKSENGASVIELALLLPLLILMLLGTADVGRAFYAAIELASAAHAGAMYGTQNPTDAAGMKAAAILDANDVPGMTATATFGCECADGTSAQAGCATAPNCATNVVRYVQVQTALTYRLLFTWPGVPTSFPIQSMARLRAGQ